MKDSETKDESQEKGSSRASGSSLNTSSSDPASSYVVHLLLPCDEGDHVLAEIVAECDVRLPRVKIPLHDDEYFAKHILEKKVEEVCPYPICLVKRLYLYKEDDIDDPGRKVINDLWIVHPAGDLPPVTEPLIWVHQDDLLSHRWLNAIQYLIRGHVFLDVEDLFEDIHSGVETRAKPWQALGFYKRLMSWTSGVLRGRSMVMEGRVRLLQDGEENRIFTCTARLQDDGRTDHGPNKSEVMFIKSTFPFAREVQRTVAVASVFGNIVPEILGFDAPWGILVQRAVGEVKDEPFDQEALIGTILYAQRVSLNHIEELEGKGLGVMDTEWLELNLDSILHHVIFEEFFAFEEEARISRDKERETVKSLRSKVSEIRQLCHHIMKLGLPNTIVHGDYRMHNIGSSITTREGKLYRIFDWANAYIGSPLYDLDSIFASASDDAGGKMDWEAGLHQMCKQWKQLRYLTHAEIRKAFHSMRMLSFMFHLYELEQQRDSYMATAKDEREIELGGHSTRIFDTFANLLDNLGHVNEHIQPRSQG